jgi:hypothetical protein
MLEAFDPSWRPSMNQRVCALLLAAALVIAAPAVLAEDGGGVAAIPGQAFDLLVLRPLGVGKVVFGFAAFLLAAPGAQSDVGEVWHVFVVRPFEATFRTPLGELQDEL